MKISLSKNKVVLSLLGLVLVNGASLAAFDLGSASFSFPFSGGGISSKLSDLGNYFAGGDKLFIESPQTRDVSLRELNKNIDSLNLSLDVSKIQENKVLKDLEIIDSSSSSRDIKALYDEISKEQKVNQVDKDAQLKLSKELGKLKSNHSSFKSALTKIADYNRPTPPTPKRTRRSTGDQQTKPLPSLSKNEREALQKFLSSFENLNNEGKSLTKRLGEASGLITEEGVSLGTTSKYSVKEMISALGEIKWTGEKLLLKKTTFTTSGRKKRSISPKETNLYGWGEWETSPWKYFFDTKTEWTQKIKEMDSAESNLKSFYRRAPLCLLAIIGGPTLINYCARGKKDLEDKVSRARDIFALHIAYKLTKQMNVETGSQ